MLPKVHKEGNPGRPVVSSIDYHTTKNSKYIDNQLQLHVKELKSYVKNFYTENKQHGKNSREQHPCNHGRTFPIYKYFKQERN